jgi:hypothetical protein
MAGMEQMEINVLRVAPVRFVSGRRENLVILSPVDQDRRLVLAKIHCRLG